MKKILFILIGFMGAVTVLMGHEADSLDYYLEIAARNNPAVKAAFKSYEASLQKVPQAGAYEDPKLDMGFFLEPMETLGGKQIAQFQLMQMFPWFGTKKASQTEAQHMAKMAFEQFRETRDKLFWEVSTQWFILSRLQQEFRYNQENLNLLQQLEGLALQKFKSPRNSNGRVSSLSMKKADTQSSMASQSMPGMGGMDSKPQTNITQPYSSESMGNMAMNGNMPSSQGGMSEVLRIRLEIVELENRLASLDSEIISEKARFNSLLNRRPESQVSIPDSIVQTGYLLDIESVINLVKAQNPMLGMLHEESLAYEAKVNMAKKMGMPMFGIGLQYMLIGKKAESSMDMGMSSMNGKDMIMPMVSITIPIFRGKYKAAQKEASLQQQASQSQYENTLNMIEADLYRISHRLDDASRKIALYQKQAAIARAAYDLAVREFVSSQNDLSAVIQVQRQLLDYQLKEAEAIAEYNTMVANIRKMISTRSIEGQ
jgi:outer membrane protein TolC